jgi:SMI1 / KNR4 family (SUKH-1)
MTESDMQRLEKSIGQTLPAPMRTFFLNFPPALRDIEVDPDADDFMLSDDADELIAYNTPGKSFLQPLDWTPDVFILGSGGCGETFWIDLGSERGSVHRFDSGEEAGASAELAESIEEFAQGFINE